MPFDEWNCDETLEPSLPSSVLLRFNIVNDFTPEEEAQVREDGLLGRCATAPGLREFLM